MSHYKHLTTKERESILVLLTQGVTIRKIAEMLNRSPSTVSRELKRNTDKEGYSPSQAAARYNIRRLASRRRRIFDNPLMKAFVQEKLLESQWSPEQIAFRTKLENSPFHCSTTTIYRAIYDHLLEVKKLSNKERGIVLKLRHKGKRRRKQGEKETRGKIRISNPIEERPSAANDRSEFGHWEADTVVGKFNSACLLTLTDRKSRFLLTQKLPRKDGAAVRDGMIALLSALPPSMVRSVTPDRGKEFAFHTQVSEALDGLPFYFPAPHAPWQRGTNENTNGLIREYCPKGTDLQHFPDDFFSTFTFRLNLRPRKCLGWRSPFEIFFHKVLHLT